MYYVYVLKSPAQDDIYIGYSSDLKRRMAEHASASSHSGWTLIYYEAYLAEADARQREGKLKHHGSGKVELKNV